MFLLKDYQSFHYVFPEKYTQNSLDYQIQNMIHQVVQLHHSMLEINFKFTSYMIFFMSFHV